jgi:hypothetical protein
MFDMNKIAAFVSTLITNENRPHMSRSEGMFINSKLS